MSDQVQEAKLNIKLEQESLQSFVNLPKKITSDINYEEINEQTSSCLYESGFSPSTFESKQHKMAESISNKCIVINQLEDQHSKVGRDGSPSVNQSSETFHQKEETTFQELKQDISFVSTSKQNRKAIFTAKPSDHLSKIVTTKTSQYLASHPSSKRERDSLKDKICLIFTYHRIRKQLLRFISHHTVFGRTKKLNTEIRQCIDDKSDCFEIENQQSSKPQQLLKFFKLLFLFLQNLFLLVLEKIPLLNPENKFRIMINATFFCYNCFYLIITSFILFFEAEFGEYEHYFNYIAIVAWVSEMLMQMNTATYHEGEFVTDRKIIFQIYLKEYFFFEILPLIFEGKNSSNIGLDILFHLPLLLKLKGMSIIFSKLEFLILQHLKKHYVLQMIKLLLQLLLLIHLMACSYITLSSFEQNILGVQETWFETSKIISDKSDWWSAYIEAQLWAFHTMGNASSDSVITQYEYAFTSFWMLISSVLYAYLINNIGNILQDITLNSENYRRDINILNRYMKRKKIDLELQRIMNIHLVKQYEQESQQYYELEQETLNKLNLQMKNKLMAESNKNIIQMFQFLKTFSLQTLSNVYLIMQEENYSEGQMISVFDQNLSESYVYLILQGSVDIIQQIDLDIVHEDNVFLSFYQQEKKKLNNHKNTNSNDKKIIKRLHEGECFGEYEFFTNITLSYTVQSQKNTTVMKISRAKFINIIKNNKQDFQKFMELKQRVEFSNELNLIQNCCLLCQDKSHHFLDCTTTHLPKSKQLVFHKQNYSQTQQRNSSHQRRVLKAQQIVVQMKSNQKISQIDVSDLSLSGEEESTKAKIQAFTSQFSNAICNLLVNQYQDCNDMDDGDYIKKCVEQSNELNPTNLKKASTLVAGNQQSLSNIANTNSSNSIGMINMNGNNAGKKRSSVRPSLLVRNSQLFNNFNFMEIYGNAEKSAGVGEESMIRSPIKQNKINVVENLIYGNPQSYNSSHTLGLKNSRSIVYNINNPNSGIDQRSLLETEQLTMQSYNESQERQDSSQNFMKIRKPSVQRQHFQSPNQQRSWNQIVQNPYLDVEVTYEWDRSIAYWAFDKMQEYLYFFPHYNCQSIIKEYNIKREKQRKQRKKIITKCLKQANSIIKN